MYVRRSTTNTYARTPHVNDTLFGGGGADDSLMKSRILNEFDAAQGYISMDSPLGRALLRKGLDDEVKVEVPGGNKAYIVVNVRYETTD